MLPERQNTDPPFFFRRIMSGTVDTDTVTLQVRGKDGTLYIFPDVTRAELPPEYRDLEPVSIIPDGLVIYGRRVVPMREDAAVVARWEAQGRCWSECYSVVEREGEVGTHPYAAVTEISRDEFEAAKARGWE